MSKENNIEKKDREIVYDILYDSLVNGRFSNDALRRVSSEHMAFVTDSVYGVIERKETLEFILKKYSKMPIEKIEPEAKVLLFIGIYHLLFTGVKEYAAIYEIVELAKKIKHNGVSSFINGILRKVQREKVSILEEIENSDFSIKYSISNEFLKLLRNSYSESEIQNILEESLRSPMVHLYIRRNKEEIKQILANNSMNYEEIEDFLLVRNYDHKVLLKNYYNGDYAIIDYSTSFIRKAYNYMDDDIKTVLDMCAAPGGKTLLYYDLLDNPKIIAEDLNEKRVGLLKKNIERWGTYNVISKFSDATIYDGGHYDLVICDVPCSGSAVIRRRPEIKYKVNREMIDELNIIQEKILETASKYALKYVIYSTCSILKEENQDIVYKSLERLKLKLVYEEQVMVNDIHEGFYFALLKKEE